jgi:hypothetical protein
MGNTVALQESQWCKIENWVAQKRVVGVGTLAALYLVRFNVVSTVMDTFLEMF